MIHRTNSVLIQLKKRKKAKNFIQFLLDFDFRGFFTAFIEWKFDRFLLPEQNLTP